MWAVADGIFISFYSSFLQMGNWLVHSPVLTKERPWLAFSPSMPLHPSVQHCQLSSLEALREDFLNTSTKDPVYKAQCCLHLYFMLHDSHLLATRGK